MAEDSDGEPTLWQTEQVLRSELRVGDEIELGNGEWAKVVKIVEADENQPDWEKPLGKRGFLVEYIDEDRRTRSIFDWDYHDQYPVTRRRRE